MQNNINEAGGKHYGAGLQPWDLQRHMPTWGSVFIDARRTDAMEYLFRKKGDRAKQLDDAKKALHNVQVIIEELEKVDPQIPLPLDNNVDKWGINVHKGSGISNSKQACETK